MGLGRGEARGGGVAWTRGALPACLGGRRVTAVVPHRNRQWWRSSWTGLTVHAQCTVPGSCRTLHFTAEPQAHTHTHARRTCTNWPHSLTHDHPPTCGCRRPQARQPRRRRPCPRRRGGGARQPQRHQGEGGLLRDPRQYVRVQRGELAGGQRHRAGGAQAAEQAQQEQRVAQHGGAGVGQLRGVGGGGGHRGRGGSRM